MNEHSSVPSFDIRKIIRTYVLYWALGVFEQRLLSIHVIAIRYSIMDIRHDFVPIRVFCGYQSKHTTCVISLIRAILSEQISSIMKLEDN